MSRRLDTLEGDMTDFANITDIGHEKLRTLHLEAQMYAKLEPQRVERRQQIRHAITALRLAMRQLMALEPTALRDTARRAA
jgi:hypothetical protein